MASTSWIIRLQNLPWEASAGDVRSFFAGLKIPDGAVHIVGGDQGDAFIGFATDDDARLAMRRDGQQLKSAQVKLYLSSRKEMEDVVAAARCQYGPAAGGDADSVASGQTAGGAQSHQHDQPPRQLRSPDKGAAPKPPFSHDSPSRQQQHLQRQQHQQQVLVSQHNVAAALRGTQPQHNPQPLPPQQQHQVQPPQQQVQPGVMYTAAMAAGRPGGPQFGQAPQPVPAAEQMAPFGSVPRQGQMGPPPNMSQQQQQQPPMQQPQPFGQPNQFDNFHPQHGGQLQQQQQPPPQPLAQFRAPLQSEQSGTPTAQAVADVMSQALGRQPQQHVQQQFPSAPLDNDGRPAAQQAWMQQQQQLQPPFQDGGRFQQTQHPHQDWRASRQPQRDDSYASQPPQRDSSYGSQMPQRDSYGSQMPQRDVKYGAQPPQRDAGYVAQQPQRDGGYGSQQPQRDGGYVSQQQQPPRDGGYGSQQQQPPRDVNYGSQQPQRDSNYRSQPPQRDGNYGSRPPQRDSSYGSQPPQRDVAAEAGGWRPRPDVHNVEQQGYESKYNQRMGNVQPSRGGGIGRSGGSDFNLPPQRSSRASFPPGPGAEPPFGRNVDHNDSPFSRGSGRAASRARGAAESFTPRGRGLSRGGGMERGSMERSSGGSMERGGFMERGGGSVDRRGGGGNLERGRFMDRGGGPAEPVGQSWRPEPAAAVAAAPLAVKSEPRDVKPDVGMSQVQKQFQKSLESATTAYKAEQQMMMQQQQQQRPPTPPKPNMPPVFGAQPGSLLDRVAPPHQLPQQPTAAEANRRGLGLLAPPPPQQRQLDAPPQQLLTGQQNAAGASPSLTSVVSLGQTNLPLNLAPSPLVASAQQQQQLQQQQQQQQQQQLQQQQQTQQHPQALLDINFSPFATKPPGDVGGANILDRRQSAANMLDRVPPPHDAAMGGTPTFGTAAAAFGGDAQPGKFAAPLLIQPSPLRYQKPQQVQLQQPPAAVPPSDAFGGILDRFYVRVSNIPRELLSRGPPAVELGRFFGRDLTLREADLHVDRHGRVAVVRVNSQRDVETIRTKNGIMNVVVGDSTVDEFDSVGRAAVQGSSGTTANASMGAAAAQQQQQQPTAAAAAPSLWVSLSNVPYRSTKADIDDWLTQHKMPMPLTIENKLAPNGRASDVWLLEFSKLGESASVLALNERRPSPVIAEKGTGRTRIVRISYTADRPTTLGKRGTRSRSPQHKFAPKPNRDRSPAVKKHRRSPEHQRNGDAHRPTAAGRGAPADKREPVKMGHGSGAGAKRRTPTPPKKAPTPETEFWVCASSLPSDMSAAAVRAQFIKATDCDVLDVRHRIDQGKAFVRLPSAEDKTRALRLDGKYVGLQRIVVRSCSMRDAHTSLDPEPPVAAPNAECNSGEDNLPHAHPPGHILYVPPGAAPPEAAKVPKKPNRALMDDLRKKFPGGGVLSISGLPHDTKMEDLLSLFSAYGLQRLSVRMYHVANTQTTGDCVLLCRDSKAAAQAARQLDGCPVRGNNRLGVVCYGDLHLDV